jgi:hypothetical protein
MSDPLVVGETNMDGLGLTVRALQIGKVLVRLNVFARSYPMQTRNFSLLVVVALLAALLFGSSALAQPGRGGGPGGFGGPGGMMGGGGLLRLAMNEAVQKECEILEDQVAELRQLDEKLRAERGQTERPDWRNMSEEDRQAAMEQMREQMAKQAAAANQEVEKILLPPQVKRLKEIALQQQGIRALTNDEVATALNLNATQKEKIAAQLEENQGQMRDRMQGIDRENLREEMAKIRTEMEGKVLAILTNAQKAKFEEMKGEAFEMPQPQFGGPGGRGGQQPQGGPGAGPGRGQRGPGGGQGPQGGDPKRRPGGRGPNA